MFGACVTQNPTWTATKCGAIYSGNGDSLTWLSNRPRAQGQFLFWKVARQEWLSVLTQDRLRIWSGARPSWTHVLQFYDAATSCSQQLGEIPLGTLLSLRTPFLRLSSRGVRA